MIFQQHYLQCLSQASYLIGDEETGTAVVVDPRRDVDVYVQEAAKYGLVIRHVFLTHFHADFVSGHLELRRRTGAEIHLGSKAKAEYEFSPAADGDRLELGQLAIEVLETPGHTPESISLAIFDLAESAEVPHAVLTGDALFVGDVGRPDLLVSVGLTSEELAGMLYDSLHQKLLKLPDTTLVYPAHGAGSACGKNLGSETFSTVGAQRETNYALQPMTRADFITQLTTGLAEAPAYFAWDADYNRRDHDVLEDVLERELRPVPLDEAVRLKNMGATLLDVRDPAVYAAGHLVGSTNIGLGGRFASWCGTLLDRERPIVVIAEPGREREAALRLGRIGYDLVEGYLEGGPASFEGHEELCRSHPRVEADELARQLEGEAPPLVLDVRTPTEWEAGHVEGSLNAPLQTLDEHLDALPRDRAITLQCQTGYRSSVAASLLEQAGFRDLADLEGGWVAWVERRAAGVGPDS
jgi:glyoxylase-like metal-dependent hydrolase (beta-lactamase superfamily II)/rhodanese-related sulfurtransferase